MDTVMELFPVLKVQAKCSPVLDPEFVPAKLWNQCYLDCVREHAEGRKVVIQIFRPDATAWTYATMMLPAKDKFLAINYRYLERLLKFLLWAWGGHEVRIEGAPELVTHLCRAYSPMGARAFDYAFMGETCFLSEFQIKAVDTIPESVDPTQYSDRPRSLDGCRIGFDLGGSDRKCAALIDGEVVFTEEIKWDPYFQSDPMYHLQGIQDSLERAARHLPRIDAIGGSAAGVYVNSEPRVASLFRGVPKKDFEKHIRPLFKKLQAKWDGVPFEVQNDGDVTALAGALSLGSNGVLGISMGTSQAAGFIDQSGRITGWLNELAFAPVDYREDAAEDEWSGDVGCGVQYFSQQGVGRLLSASGLDIDKDLPLPEKLETLQDAMKQGDDRAASIYQTVGAYFGYSIAHYADFYDFQHLLFLGRVSSGRGGQVILEEAQTVLKTEFPELADRLNLTMPDEKMKRHGQAVAAAILPVI